MEEMRIQSEDVGVDYINDIIDIDPWVGVLEFESMMCQELGMPVTEKSREYIATNYIKVITICENDGFYIFTNHKVTAQKTAFVPYPMFPYTGTFHDYGDASNPEITTTSVLGTNTGRFDDTVEGTEDRRDDVEGADGVTRPTGKQYAMTLACDKLYECEYVTDMGSGHFVINNVSTTKTKVLDGSGPTETTQYVPTPSIKQEMRDIINADVENYLRSAINDVYTNTQAYTVIMPSGLDNVNGGQGINGLTFLAITDTSRSANPYTSAFGVGGTTIYKSDPIVAWTIEEPYHGDLSHTGTSTFDSSTTFGDKRIAVGDDAATLTGDTLIHHYWATQSRMSLSGYLGPDSMADQEPYKRRRAAVAAGKVYQTPFDAAENGYSECWEVMAYNEE